VFSCSKIEQKQLNTWVSFQSAEQPLLGQFSVSGNIHTVDFDCFVIVNFAPGGLQSLRHLIDLYETARMVQSRWCLQ